DGRMRPPRDVEVETAPRDRLCEDVERDVADQPCVADVTAGIGTAEREVDLRVQTARVTAERLHPLTAELVSVAVEEDVVLLVDSHRLEELGICRPEHW